MDVGVSLRLACLADLVHHIAHLGHVLVHAGLLHLLLLLLELELELWLRFNASSSRILSRLLLANHLGLQVDLVLKSLVVAQAVLDLALAGVGHWVLWPLLLLVEVGHPSLVQGLVHVFLGLLLEVVGLLAHEVALILVVALLLLQVRIAHHVWLLLELLALGGLVELGHATLHRLTFALVEHLVRSLSGRQLVELELHLILQLSWLVRVVVHNHLLELRVHHLLLVAHHLRLRLLLGEPADLSGVRLLVVHQVHDLLLLLHALWLVGLSESSEELPLLIVPSLIFTIISSSLLLLKVHLLVAVAVDLGDLATGCVDLALEGLGLGLELEALGLVQL